MHQLIAAPFLDEGHLILQPGSEQGMRIPAGHYEQLRDLSARNGTVPDWLTNAAKTGWGLRLRDEPINQLMTVRQPSTYGYERATWELNLGCNYDCEHCYLDLKRFEGMGWDQRVMGSDRSLAVQSIPLITKRKPFTGCNAGHTFFHVDPHGKASICKIGRDPNIDLLAEGVEGLRRLGGIADGLLARQGGCSGCSVQGSCGTCMPLVQLYRKAKSPMERYCQHRETGEVIINGTDNHTEQTDSGHGRALATA